MARYEFHGTPRAKIARCRLYENSAYRFFSIQFRQEQWALRNVSDARSRNEELLERAARDGGVTRHVRGRQDQ